MSDVSGYLDGDSQSKNWIKAHLDYPHRDWCLIWPFSRSQSGYVMIGKQSIRVHRIMCEHRHGPAPTPEHHAAHSCDRGHEGCVNPWHLDWKTPTENQLDRHRETGATPQRKLTPEQAREIRDLKGLEHILDTAARFDISESNVRLIQAGKTWREDTRGRHIFTREEVLLIRETPWEVKTARQFATELGAALTAVQRIRQGRSYKWVKPEPAQRGGEA